MKNEKLLEATMLALKRVKKMLLMLWILLEIKMHYMD